MDPGPQLRGLHVRVLRDDTSLLEPSPEPVIAPRVGVLVPAQLPRAPSGFAGREDELAWLARLLPAARRGRGEPAIAVLAGPAGVGKTALAVLWAHRVADRFPDGQLFASLRGFDPQHAPASAGRRAHPVPAGARRRHGGRAGRGRRPGRAVPVDPGRPPRARRARRRARLRADPPAAAGRLVVAGRGDHPGPARRAGGVDRCAAARARHARGRRGRAAARAHGRHARAGPRPGAAPPARPAVRAPAAGAADRGRAADRRSTVVGRGPGGRAGRRARPAVRAATSRTPTRACARRST